MKQKTKQAVSGGVGVAAVGALLVTLSAVVLPLQDRKPEPTPSASATTELYMPAETTNGLMFEQEADAAAVEAARLEAERVAAEQAAAEAARLAQEAENQRIAAEQEAQRQAQPRENGSGGQQTQPSTPEQPAPPQAVQCPSGSSPNDEFTCMWDICYSLTLPDANHPECDSPFRP